MYSQHIDKRPKLGQGVLDYEPPVNAPSFTLQSEFLIPSFYTQKFYETLSSDREREEFMRQESPFGEVDSFKLRPFILKSDADIRQESFFIHLISIFSKIFRKEGLSIYLRDLDFIQLDRSTALIEYIQDSASISTLKKQHA